MYNGISYIPPAYTPTRPNTPLDTSSTLTALLFKQDSLLVVFVVNNFHQRNRNARHVGGKPNFAPPVQPAEVAVAIHTNDCAIGKHMHCLD